MSIIVRGKLLRDAVFALTGCDGNAVVILTIEHVGRPFEVRKVYGSNPRDVLDAQDFAKNTRRGMAIDVVANHIDIRSDHGEACYVLREPSSITVGPAA